MDVINNSPHLKITFPTYVEQDIISRGFKQMSDTKFDNKIGAVDGFFIWTKKP